MPNGLPNLESFPFHLVLSKAWRTSSQPTLKALFDVSQFHKAVGVPKLRSLDFHCWLSFDVGSTTFGRSFDVGSTTFGGSFDVGSTTFGGSFDVGSTTFGGSRGETGFFRHGNKSSSSPITMHAAGFIGCGLNTVKLRSSWELIFLTWVKNSLMLGMESGGVDSSFRLGITSKSEVL